MEVIRLPAVCASLAAYLVHGSCLVPVGVAFCYSLAGGPRSSWVPAASRSLPLLSTVLVAFLPLPLLAAYWSGAAADKTLVRGN